MTEMMVAMVSKMVSRLRQANDAQHQAHSGTQRHSHAAQADLNGDGQAALDELGDGCILEIR